MANDDPLPNQSVDDTQPPPIQEDRVEGYIMKDIMAEKKRKVGKRSKKEYEMKWRRYIQMIWEPIENLEKTEALDQ